MTSGSGEIYVAAFLTRCAALRAPDQPILDEAGMHGLPPSSRDGHVRLLVTDDRAHDVLVSLLPDARAGMITVFAAARQSAGLLDRHPTWRSGTAAAMVCRDLHAVPELPLPDGLSLRPVRRVPEDPHDGVLLRDAVAAAAAAAPASIESPRALAEYLRSLPPTVRLFAAVDAAGAVRATAGAGAFGDEATVMFVNTDPRWRRRGIGLAMTAAALRCARAGGARRACLDASQAGARMYSRLGFELVTKVTRFVPL